MEGIALEGIADGGEGATSAIVFSLRFSVENEQQSNTKRTRCLRRMLELMDGGGLVFSGGSLGYIYMRLAVRCAYKNDTGVREGLRAPPAGMLHHFQHRIST